MVQEGSVGITSESLLMVKKPLAYYHLHDEIRSPDSCISGDFHSIMYFVNRATALTNL